VPVVALAAAAVDVAAAAAIASASAVLFAAAAVCVSERPSRAAGSTGLCLLAVHLQPHSHCDWLVGTNQPLTSLQLRWSQVARNQSPALQRGGAEDQQGCGLQAVASSAVHADMVGTLFVPELLSAPELLSVPAARTCLA